MPSLPLPVIVALVWVFVAPMWTPMLASSRIRALFEGWPTGRLSVNYALISAGVILVHAAAFFAGGLTVIPVNQGIVMLEWLFALNVLVPAVGWLIGVVGLPLAGREWDPDGHGLGTAAVLGLGALWYTVLTTLALGALAFLAFLIGFPG